MKEDIEKLNNNECDIINEYVLKEAIKKIAKNKSDPFSSVSSNNFHLGTELAVSFLTILIRAIVTHNHIPSGILLAKVIPLIKDKDGDNEDSDNYRSICLSSLILKIIVLRSRQ